MHPTSWEKNIPHASHIYDILQTAKPPVSFGGQCTNNIILIHCQSKDNRPRQSHQLNVNPIPFERQFIVNPLPIWCKSCANLISIQCQYHINCQTDINQKPMGCQSSLPGCQFIAYPLHNWLRPLLQGSIQICQLCPHFEGKYHFHFLNHWVLL